MDGSAELLAPAFSATHLTGKVYSSPAGLNANKVERQVIAGLVHEGKVGISARGHQLCTSETLLVQHRLAGVHVGYARAFAELASADEYERVRQLGETIEASGVASPQRIGMVELQRNLVDALAHNKDPSTDTVDGMSYDGLYLCMHELGIDIKGNLKKDDVVKQVRAILRARADVRSEMLAAMEHW